MVEDIIPSLVNDQTNNVLTTIPSAKEIQDAVFALNKEGSPGPYWLGDIFFHTYWNIIKEDVINVVLEFLLLDGFSLITTLTPLFSFQRRKMQIMSVNTGQLHLIISSSRFFPKSLLIG